MGRYSYPCPKCGTIQTEKTDVRNSDEIAHKLCAACEEEVRHQARIADEEAEHRQRAKR